jgi:YfiR/HmsC-like
MAILKEVARFLTSVRISEAGMRDGPRKPRTPENSRARRSLVALLLAALFSLVCIPGACGQTEVLGEYQLKAAFLFNFAKFIEWPAASFAAPQSPFVICIMGTDPFGRTMDDALQGKTVGDRPVTVERSKDLAEARHCQMIFVSSSEKHRVADILEGLRGAKVLVVGETDGFAAAGGTIQFTLEENRVRFLINTDAASRAGLNVSSKLLSLARVVHDSAKGSGG